MERPSKRENLERERERWELSRGAERRIKEDLIGLVYELTQDINRRIRKKRLFSVSD